MTAETKPRLIIIVGPTAVGKTDLAIPLAQELGGEIISADSMQVYRHMDIGTAKPSPDQRRLIPHHVLDVVDPDQAFNAALFIEAARPVIRDLHRQRKPVLVVGGTGLYIRTLLGGLFPGPSSDEALRSHYRRQQETFGQDYLYRELQRLDHLAARQINPRDKNRIIRALEVMELTGRSIVESQEEHSFLDKHYDCLTIGLNMDRTALFDRIDQRTRHMVEIGLIDEVRKLFALGFHENLKPMQSMGYKHAVHHLKGGMDLEEVIRRTARDTRHYAKRQWTWFRAGQDVEWFFNNEYKRIVDRVLQFLDGGKPEIA